MKTNCNMATLLFKKSSASDKLKIKQNNTTATTLFTSNLTDTQIRTQHHHYQCKNNSDDVGDDEKEVQHHDNTNDFYHIKQCYLPTKIKDIKLLNQRKKRRRNYHNNTTAVVTPITSTANSHKVLSSSHVLNSTFSGNYCHRFTTTIFLILCLLLFFHSLALAAPQSCILCDKNDLLAKDPQTTYEEFLFEHQVTRQDAINALRQLNESFYEGMASDSSCNAVRCTDKVMKYCLGPQFINDHCWCELGHSTEGLPFVPHICYVGEKVYKTSVGSCFFYEEVKECCCSSVLAKEWRHISAGSSVYSKSLLHDYLIVAVINSLYLLIR